MTRLPDDYIGVYGTVLVYNDVTEGNYGRMATHSLPPPSQYPLSGDLSSATLIKNILNFSTFLVRKSTLVKAGLFDEDLRQNEDWDICLRLTRHGRIGFVPEPLILLPTPLDPAINDARVSRSVQQGARSFVRITGKLRRAGIDGPELSTHYVSAALYLLRVNHPRFARRFLRAALTLRAWQPRLWVHYLLSFTPGLHAIIRKKR